MRKMWVNALNTQLSQNNRVGYTKPVFSLQKKSYAANTAVFQTTLELYLMLIHTRTNYIIDKQYLQQLNLQICIFFIIWTTFLLSKYNKKILQ